MEHVDPLSVLRIGVCSVGHQELDELQVSMEGSKVECCESFFPLARLVNPNPHHFLPHSLYVILSLSHLELHTLKHMRSPLSQDMLNKQLTNLVIVLVSSEVQRRVP
jgi:hypothetical protein